MNTNARVRKNGILEKKLRFQRQFFSGDHVDSKGLKVHMNVFTNRAYSLNNIHSITQT